MDGWKSKAGQIRSVNNHAIILCEELSCFLLMKGAFCSHDKPSYAEATLN
jgi:hypothetical protein